MNVFHALYLQWQIKSWRSLVIVLRLQLNLTISQHTTSTAVSLLLYLTFWPFPRGKVHAAVLHVAPRLQAVTPLRGPAGCANLSTWMNVSIHESPVRSRDRLVQNSERKIKMNCTDSVLLWKALRRRGNLLHPTWTKFHLRWCILSKLWKHGFLQWILLFFSLSLIY